LEFIFVPCVAKKFQYLLPSRLITLEQWNDGIVDKWVFLDRIASQFKLKNRPIPIINPIFRYSSIPGSFMQILTILSDENLFGSG